MAADEGPAGRDGTGTTVSCVPTRPALSARDERRLVDGLVAALPDLRMRELFELRRDMLVDADYLVATVADGDDQVVGVLASKWVELPSGRRCLHVLMQMVGGQHRRGVVFRRSWARHFGQLLREGAPLPEVVVLKTYNPVAYCAIRAFARAPETAFYPDVDSGGGVVPDPRLERLAAEAAATISPAHAFDPATGVIRGVGEPKDLYREVPLSSVGSVNTYFGRAARPGDRVLCLLHVPSAAGWRVILPALGLPDAAAAGQLDPRPSDPSAASPAQT